MIVKYGSYSFANGECSMIGFRVIPVRTPRGLRRSSKIRMDCAGEFCFSGPVDQNAIKTKIVAARTALEEDYKDLVLLHNDGVTESPYKLSNDHPTNITGNLVVASSWPGESPEDYATTKAFSFAVEAEFVNPNVALLDWGQTLSIRGTAGPIGRWERLINGQWIRRMTHASSTKIIQQTGFAIKFGSYALPAPPILAPLFEHEQDRVITRIGPSLYYSRPEFYKTTWSYTFETPLEFTPINLYPSAR